MRHRLWFICCRRKTDYQGFEKEGTVRKLFTILIFLVLVAVPLLLLKLSGDKQDEYKHSAFIANGLVLAMEVKQRVGEYYSMHGEMPENNGAMDLPSAEQFASQAVKAIEVKDGVIIVKFNQLSGVDDGVIRLMPELMEGSGLVLWNCETPSYPFVIHYAPQCRYVGI
jgi:hypothetical protein